MSGTNTTNSQIRAFILKNFPAARKRAINDETQLLGSGIVDSLGMLTVVEFLEQTFAIKLSDDELTPDNFASVNSLAAFIEKKQSRTSVLAEPS
jgi:acyl carrier protein